MLWSTAAIRESIARRDISGATGTFKSLAHPLRLRIVAVVDVNDDLSISQIAKILGVSQPLVSHHVKILVMAGMLKLLRCGKTQCPRFPSPEVQHLIRRFLLLTKGGDVHG